MKIVDMYHSMEQRELERIQLRKVSDEVERVMGLSEVINQLEEKVKAV